MYLSVRILIPANVFGYNSDHHVSSTRYKRNKRCEFELKMLLFIYFLFSTTSSFSLPRMRCSIFIHPDSKNRSFTIHEHPTMAHCAPKVLSVVMALSADMMLSVPNMVLSAPTVLSAIVEHDALLERRLEHDARLARSSRRVRTREWWLVWNDNRHEIGEKQLWAHDGRGSTHDSLHDQRQRAMRRTSVFHLEPQQRQQR